MLESHLQHLVCPSCRIPLVPSKGAVTDGTIFEGLLRCKQGHTFPVTSGIARFVPADNYAASFGLEWNQHALTQYDSHSGVALSETRFFEETGWPRRMEGEIIVEAGCGSGRFTEQAA